ncbi:MAG: hypothetical protein ABIJ92_01995 [Candidatus Aenigmatarchaeota archaeon]
MRTEIIGALFVILTVVSILQAVTVMSLSEKLDSSFTGNAIAGDQKTVLPSSATTTDSPKNVPEKTSTKSLSDLAGMVGGC